MKPNLVIGISSEKKNNLFKIVHKELDFEYNKKSKNWIVSYYGVWTYYYAQENNEYKLKKYTHESI